MDSWQSLSGGYRQQYIRRDRIAYWLESGLCAPRVDPCHGQTFPDDGGL